MSWISSAQGQASTRASLKKGLGRNMKVVSLLLNLIQLRLALQLHDGAGLLGYTLCLPRKGCILSEKLSQAT